MKPLGHPLSRTMKRQSRNKKFSTNLEDKNFGLKKLQNLPGRVEIFLEAQEFIFKLKFLQRTFFTIQHTILTLACRHSVDTFSKQPVTKIAPKSKGLRPLIVFYILPRGLKDISFETKTKRIASLHKNSPSFERENEPHLVSNQDYGNLWYNFVFFSSGSDDLFMKSCD